jgi:nucleotide-binding universal stress UspA family protein
MKSILVPVEDHDSITAVLEAAVLLAREFDSYIEGFAVHPSIGASVTIEPLSGISISAEYKDDSSKVAQARFEAFMRERGVPRSEPGLAVCSYGWPNPDGADDDFIGNYGRVFDLIILGRPGGEATNPRMAPLEAALFEAGRPVLVIPSTAPKDFGHNILLSWNGSVEQARTNTFALPILRRADRVIVLTVEGGTIPGSTGEQAVVQLVRNGIKASALTVKPEGRAIGEVILRQAASLGCDLLVKGAYTQSRLRQLIFGGATRHILDNATLPVFVAH